MTRVRMTKRILARLAVIALAIVTIVPMGATAAHADASIDGAGSTWSQIAVDQWRADVARQGLSINYQGVGLDLRPRLLLPGSSRLRSLGDPVHEGLPRRVGHGLHQRGIARGASTVRVPPDRRGRHFVHVPPRHQREARHQPAPLARDDREDLHRGHHEVERPRDRRRQPAVAPAELGDPAGRALRRFGHDGAVHRVHGQPDARPPGTRSVSARA